MTAQELDRQLARDGPSPLYLVIGDDEQGKDEVVARLAALVEEDLRAFNVERFHADSKAHVAVSAARTLPMMGGRRVVFLRHAERLFKTRGKASVDDEDDEEERGDDDLAALEAYVAQPEPSNVLVLVATDINRTMRLGKLLMKHAAVVECRGFADGAGRPDAGLREAMQFVASRLEAAGKRAGVATVSAIVQTAGPNIVRLRADVERLVLYAGDATEVTDADVRAVMGAPVSLDDWGVTNAIAARDARAALKLLDLTLENGAVPFMVLGQLGWWVRSRMAQSAPARVPDAVRAVLRCDADMKSGGQPRVVLERLVVELCGPARSAAGPTTSAAARPAFTPRARR